MHNVKIPLLTTPKPSTLAIIYDYYYQRGLLSILLRYLYLIYTISILLILFNLFIKVNVVLNVIVVLPVLIFVIVKIISCFKLYKLIKTIDIDIDEPWNVIVDKLCKYYNIGSSLIYRIMLRKVNYIKSHIDFYPNSLTFEWIMDIAFWDYILNNNTNDIVNTINTVKYRIILTSIIYILLSPLILIYYIGYYILTYFDHIKSHPVWLLDRKWMIEGKWMLRRYNEPLHCFEYRLSKIKKSVDRYIELVNTSVLFLWLIRILKFTLGTFLTVSIIYPSITSTTIVGLVGLLLFSIYRLPTKIYPIGDEVNIYLTKIREQLGNNVDDNFIRSMYRYRLWLFIYEILAILWVPWYFIIIYINKIPSLVNYINEVSIYDTRFGIIYNEAC